VAKHPQSLRGSRASVRAAGVAGAALKKYEFSEPWEGSLSPRNLLSAYSLSSVPAPAAQQTLALVDAYNDPTAEHDLKVFDEQFDLPACTTANGCFTKVALHSPATNAGWAQETATDIEVAHGVCPSCKLLLLEASSNENGALEEAEREAERLGANEISNSWGGPEHGVTAHEDATDAFNHPGTVITAAAGDDGYLDWGLEEASERGYADYPASSPHVIAVGGTRLTFTAGGAWKDETVWNGDGAGGGGCSTVLEAPAWQQSLSDWSAVGCGSHRAVADVSADADPYTGVAVYDSTPVREGEVEYRGWVPIGGTSVASPIIASTFALAGGAGTSAGGKAVEYPARTLYENFAANSAALHDVTVGSNGACTKGFDEETGASACTLAEEDASCSAAAICLARPGYDGPSGVGTPNGIADFLSPGEAARIKQLEEQKTAEERQAEEKKKAEEEHKAEEERLTERKAEEELRIAEEKKAEERKKAEEELQAKRKAEEERRVAEERQTAEERKAAEESLLAEESKTAKEALEAEERAEQSRAAGLPGGGSQASTGALSGGAPLTPSLVPLEPVVPVLSAPALTPSTLAALRHGSTRVSSVAFAFTLNVPARVRVTLAKRVGAPGHTRWRALAADSRTLAATAGRDHAHLSAHGTLAPGRYRLTLAPALGVSISLGFRVG
jgi:DNA segregation ATPase FtsK/SpoIIIE-like protein